VPNRDGCLRATGFGASPAQNGSCSLARPLLIWASQARHADGPAGCLSLAPVGPDSVGGVEQALYHLEAGLAARGCETIVIACEGPEVAGRLVPCRALTRPTMRRQSKRTRAPRGGHSRHAGPLARRSRSHARFDFDRYLPAPVVPVLATLHCPAAWYSAEALDPPRPGVWLNAVSRMQPRSFPLTVILLPFVANGVPVEAFSTRHDRRDFALVLARIAPDKGIREALQAARIADVPLLVAGEIYPNPEHRRYFARGGPALLDDRRRYLGPIGFTASGGFWLPRGVLSSLTGAGDELAGLRARRLHPAPPWWRSVEAPLSKP